MAGRIYRKICAMAFVMVMLQSSFALTNGNDDMLYSNSRTLYVGGNGLGNYTEIQTAIDQARDGDTIFVFNGTYFETILIDKSIKLIGEDKYNTVIDGGKPFSIFKRKSTIVITATADHVTISGFTIQNAIGIDGRGIYFIKKGGRAYSRNNVVTDTIIRNCSYGLLIVNPIENTVSNLSFYNCSGGFYITRLPYHKNHFYNNTANDKPLLLFVDEKNLTIDCRGAGGISLIGCKNCRVYNLSTSYVTAGIDISYSSNITVKNCTITHTNRGGIYVHHSSLCRFIGNTLKHDNWGIFLRCSNHNEIHHNNFIDITMPDWFDNSFHNNWNGNYWDRSRKFPKPIFGKVAILLKIPWFNIDWTPLREPTTPSSFLTAC